MQGPSYHIVLCKVLSLTLIRTLIEAADRTGVHLLEVSAFDLAASTPNETSKAIEVPYMA